MMPQCVLNSTAWLRVCGLLMLFSQSWTTSATTAQETSIGETVTLFNGQDLSGFEYDPKYWTVQDGVIVGEIPKRQSLDHNTWLVYKRKSFADFELRFQFQISGLPAANSGVQYRSQVESFRHVNGYQADLDMGQTWLGRIYDEHGRALLVERGTRVAIDATGKRVSQTMAPANLYHVLFREREWNDYRIVAVGPRVSVWINGTLFCELRDEEDGEADLAGYFAWQLHSGPETLLKFRDLTVETLASDDGRQGPWLMKAETKTESDGAELGIVPRTATNEVMNLGFESGTLQHWTAQGDAFRGQPVSQDGISQRWPGQHSGKVGKHFVAGYEIVGDAGIGILTSDPFVVTEPYASFLIGGGRDRSTRADLQVQQDDNTWQVIYSASGEDREAMRRAVFDMRPWRDRKIRIQLVDESAGGWGHLNFDDFRFHAQQPEFAPLTSIWRSTANPVLQHLVPNPVANEIHEPSALGTLQQMFVPPGFSVHAIAAEPRVHQPMAFTFDGRGRLWVVEGHSYPERRPEGQGVDRILVFSDLDHDGTYESRDVFYEGLNLVSALEVGHGGVWVGAAPQLLFIPDADGDLQADGPPTILLDGFGYADTHETLNNFCWGPDGWLYGNQGVFNQSYVGRPGSLRDDRVYLAAGVFRYHPTRQVFEVFAHGGSNQWGLDFDQHGQLFMTHCRSYWGGGPTTHVMSGGHYWNQVNSGYEDFISAQNLDVQPAMKNYLMASARYGHGEGGAGKPGTNAVYGGHSHVGTMLYLGDNWPAEYRNHLFTHNLHGHQMNRQINLREQGGYNTIHAGSDMLFCSDQQYIGVDLKYGPDGAVYISDWYDPRHCHNPNVEQWDRGNGRLYRMQYDANYRPVPVDLPAASDLQLVHMQRHANEWHVRMAAQELSQRVGQRALDPEVLRLLKEWMTKDVDARLRLRCLWCLSRVGSFDAPALSAAVADVDEYVRAWGVRLAVDGLDAKGQVANRAATAVEPWQSLWRLAQTETSLLVKRELASAAQRLPRDEAWRLAEILSRQVENAEDSGLVSLLWVATAQLMRDDVAAGLRLGTQCNLPVLKDYIVWYAAKTSELGRITLITDLAAVNDEDKYRKLRLLQHAVQGLGSVPMPEVWSLVAEQLYDSPRSGIRETAAAIGSTFRDPALFARYWQRLEAEDSTKMRVAMLKTLQSDVRTEQQVRLLELLEQPELAPSVLPLLRRYEDPAVGQALLGRLAKWEPATVALAMELLTSRPTWAAMLLDAVEAATIDRQMVTAYQVRQMISLGDPDLNARLEATWGKASASSEELQAQIRQIVQLYETAPLWAYDAGAGQKLFQLHCANCHQESKETASLGPPLGGSGAKGIAYVVENIVDPNAVVGRDFQARLILTVEGRVVTGLVIEETPSAVTVRTATATETISTDEIGEIRVSDQSFMPAGLLDNLEERQKIELLKYLMGL
jgi:putative membrane-bound dehydrogenase-like protein